MGRSSTDTCCLTLPLKLEKWQEDRLAKRFEIARQIYNTMVHAELKKLRNIENSQPYRQIQKQIEALNWKNQNDKARLKSLYNDRNKLLNTIGFSEYGFKADIKYYYSMTTSAPALRFTESLLRFGLPLKKCSFTRKVRKSIIRKRMTYIHCTDIR